MGLLYILFIVLQSPDKESVWLPSQTFGAIEARLGVAVKQPSPAPGYAAVTLALEIEGPPTLEVKPAVLASSAEIWEIDRATKSRLEKGRRVETQSFQLTQLKPGFVALPNVACEFREKAEADWQKVQWTGILGETREVLRPLDPPAEPEPKPTLPWWLWILSPCPAAAAVFFYYRRRPRAGIPQPTAEDAALGALDTVQARLDAIPFVEGPCSLQCSVYKARKTTVQKPKLVLRRTVLRLDAKLDIDTRWFYAEVSLVLRRYLSDRFNFPALQQTTSEVAMGVESLILSVEVKAQIVAVLQRCDQARFAREGFPLHESQPFLDTVRSLIVCPGA